MQPRFVEKQVCGTGNANPLSGLLLGKVSKGHVASSLWRSLMGCLVSVMRRFWSYGESNFLPGREGAARCACLLHLPFGTPEGKIFGGQKKKKKRHPPCPGILATGLLKATSGVSRPPASRKRATRELFLRVRRGSEPRARESSAAAAPTGERACRQHQERARASRLPGAPMKGRGERSALR